MRKVFFSLILIAFIGLFVYLHQPHIAFVKDEIHLSLYEDVRPYDYIKKTSHIDLQDIKVTHQVNNQKPGQYDIQYTYHQKTFSLPVFVDDTLPPQCDVINRKILLNESIDPSSLVENIQDDSPTIVYFQEDYSFDELKTYCVNVVIEDSYQNKTVKHAYLLVEDKDTEPPMIMNLKPLSCLMGETIDLKKNIEIKDDHDPQPMLSIDDSHFNSKKEGTYEVIYQVKDHSGNQHSYVREITVVSPYANKEAMKDGIKTCYLTFDDGPSLYTKDILDILDRYHIRATFFVTGTYPKYFPYIKIMKEKGHTIGLHTWSHDYQKIYSSVENYMADLKQIRELVYQQTGEYTSYIRFPGGSSNQISKLYKKGIMTDLTKKVIDEGYQYYDWTCVNGDGEGIDTVQGLIDKAYEEIGDQEDIMFLMHDSANGQNTIEALPVILDYLIEKGYTFLVIDEMSPTFHHTVHN